MSDKVETVKDEFRTGETVYIVDGRAVSEAEYKQWIEEQIVRPSIPQGERPAAEKPKHSKTKQEG